MATTRKVLSKAATLSDVPDVSIDEAPGTDTDNPDITDPDDADPDAPQTPESIPATPIEPPAPEDVVKAYFARLTDKEKKKLLDEVMGQPQPEMPEDFTDAELRQMARLHMGKILTSGQSYTIGSRKLNRVDFDKLADYLAATAGKDDAEDSNLMANTWVAEFIPR